MRNFVAMDSLKKLKELFSDRFGKECVASGVSGSGSSRGYYRLRSIDGAVSAIGVAGVDADENNRFFIVGDVLASAGLRVPHIYNKGDGEFVAQYYLLEDLGETDLLLHLDAPEGEALVEEAISRLAQIHACRNLPERCASAGADLQPLAEAVASDLRYFKYCFLKVSGVFFNDAAIEKEFSAICREVASLGNDDLVYRDYQSRNIMVSDDMRLGWIDYQSAMKGSGLYDLVSFLWQARAGFSREIKDRMIGVYAKKRFGEEASPEVLMPAVRLMVLVRTLQVLGAYGFRGLVERKAHFVKSIPGAIVNLMEIVESGTLDPYPELLKACMSLTRLPRFRSVDSSQLVVSIWSFSYKHGSYPDDFSGNGGGFMFDCRALENPGRYDEYKMLTGLDKEVADFLGGIHEVSEFLECAEKLVSKSVERYLQRGFTSLQVGFGCTGGRHRSVYCADALGWMLKRKFPEIIIDVVHRQQNKTYRL